MTMFLPLWVIWRKIFLPILIEVSQRWFDLKVGKERIGNERQSKWDKEKSCFTLQCASLCAELPCRAPFTLMHWSGQSKAKTTMLSARGCSDLTFAVQTQTQLPVHMCSWTDKEALLLFWHRTGGTKETFFDYRQFTLVPPFSLITYSLWSVL